MNKKQSKKLIKESAIFRKNYASWLKKYPAKFVLIKNTEVVGFFDTLEQAFSKGTAQFGLADFFIEQILPKETNNISFLGQTFPISI